MRNEALEFANAYLRHVELGPDGYASAEEWQGTENYLLQLARNIAGPKAGEMYQFQVTLVGDVLVTAESREAAIDEVVGR